MDVEKRHKGLPRIHADFRGDVRAHHEEQQHFWSRGSPDSCHRKQAVRRNSKASRSRITFISYWRRTTITAHLNTKITPQNINEITTWFTTSVPTNVRRIDIQFEGVFESESYVVMFTVPIEVWTCLRSDLGYRMTGLTKGGNKLLQRSSQVLGAKAAPKGGENVRPEFSKN
jgi:hypothetical protein